jgi:hypothetical protein
VSEPIEDQTRLEQSEREPFTIPEWVNLSLLPGGDPESIRQRTALGARGIALVTLLARWAVDAAAYIDTSYIGIDDGALRVAIETHLGYPGIDRTTLSIIEIDEFCESDGSNPEHAFGTWFKREGPVDVTGLLPAVVAWAADYMTSPQARTEPDEITDADRVAMALIGIGQYLGHQDVDGLQAEFVQLWKQVAR